MATQLLPLETYLRKYWNLAKFSGGTSEPTAPDEDWKTNNHLLDKTIRDKVFWVHARLICNLGFLGEYLGRWCEGCPCHQKELLCGFKVDCANKHCRAPELACGDGLDGLGTQLEKFRESIVPIATSATLSVCEQNDLVLLAGKVASGLSSELQMKMAHFQQLPHALCGLGHHDRAKACMTAQTCLELYKRMPESPGALHRMSQRFLNPNWNPDSEGDIPLHQYVQRMAFGEDLHSIESNNFTHWVTALATIKTVERPVEGLHSRISRITKRSPNQSMSLISLDLRFSSLLQLMKGHPELLHQCSEDVLSLERSDPFKRTVQKHLGLTAELNSDRAMANLLYRENIRLKHSKKSQTKEFLEQHNAIFRTSSQAKPVTADVMAQIAGSHLTDVACKDQAVFFLVPHDLFQKCAVPLKSVASGQLLWFSWF